MVVLEPLSMATIAIIRVILLIQITLQPFLCLIRLKVPQCSAYISSKIGYDCKEMTFVTAGHINAQLMGKR